MADIDVSGAESFQTTQSETDRAATTNRESIQAQARTALAANKTYANLAPPTAAQTTAQVKALSRQMNGVIRLLLGALEAAE